MKNSGYFIAAMMSIIGLMMLLAAESLIKVFVIVLGIAALVEGAFILISIMPMSSVRAFKIECAVRVAISFVIGLLCIILPLRMANFVWQVMIYTFAIYALVSAILEILIVLRLHSEGFPVKRLVIEIVSTLALSLILFMLPSSFGFTLIKIGGVVMILAGVSIGFLVYKNRDIIVESVEVKDAE